MSSALTPREIQTRIRSGESLEQVAKAAGVPAEKVEPFAAPVLAERAHLASTALMAPVRRTGEPTSHRSLRQVVGERLGELGVDPDEVEWDAWRVAERKWLVRADFVADDEPKSAEFLYDQLGRFSLAHNEDARALTGEQAPAPAPKGRTGDPDAEPTVDFTDEFAIVRAVGAEAPRDEGPEAEAGEEPEAHAGAASTTGTDRAEGAETNAGDAAQGAGDQADDEPEDEFGDDVELTEVDGVYDIVPTRPGGLDTLYEMFASYTEDSVEIYPGLGTVQPVGSGSPEAQPEASPASSGDRASAPADPNHAEARPEPQTAPAQPQEPVAADPRPAEPKPAQPKPTGPTSTEQHRSEHPQSEPHRTEQDLSEQTQQPEAEQPSLLGDDQPAAKPQPKKRKRASVPSWDEIMFGGPKRD